jgi:hypothetical protein
MTFANAAEAKAAYHARGTAADPLVPVEKKEAFLTVGRELMDREVVRAVRDLHNHKMIATGLFGNDEFKEAGITERREKLACLDYLAQHYRTQGYEVQIKAEDTRNGPLYEFTLDFSNATAPEANR